MNLRRKYQDWDSLPLEKIAHPLHANKLIIDLRRLTHALSSEKLEQGTFDKKLIDLNLMLLRIFLGGLCVFDLGINLSQMLCLYLSEYFDSLSVSLGAYH